MSSAFNEHFELHIIKWDLYDSFSCNLAECVAANAPAWCYIDIGPYPLKVLVHCVVLFRHKNVQFIQGPVI